MNTVPIRIAVADDHRLFRQGLRLILNDAEGIELIAEAGDGAALLRELEQQAADVVLLDLEMPGMDGEHTLPQLKELYPNTKVLILSMHRDDHVVLHLLESGADGYILKDSDPEVLEVAIRQVHQSGLYLDPEQSRLLLQRARKETRPRAPGSPVVNEREREVLNLLAQGLTTPEIGEKLFLSPRTIDDYRKNLLEKAAVKNTAALIAWAFRHSLLE